MGSQRFNPTLVERDRHKDPISTAFVESTSNHVVSTRVVNA
jgi:hypothetical protein